PHMLSHYRCYTQHLDLYSFPTRRSSDLKCISVYVFVSQGKEVGGEETQEFAMSDDEQTRWSESGSATFISLGDIYVPRRDKQITDRKSTLLNSSHVKISYAVFCLKKQRI